MVLLVENPGKSAGSLAVGFGRSILCFHPLATFCHVRRLSADSVQKRFRRRLNDQQLTASKLYFSRPFFHHISGLPTAIAGHHVSGGRPGKLQDAPKELIAMDPAETTDFRADEPGVYTTEGPADEAKDPSDVSACILAECGGSARTSDSYGNPAILTRIYGLSLSWSVLEISSHKGIRRTDVGPGLHPGSK